MAVEGGTIGMESFNPGGSADLGPMQINDSWLPKLGVLGITRNLLRDHGCVNVLVGAWILQGHLRETGSPFMALALYHSRDPKLQARYLQKVPPSLGLKPPGIIFLANRGLGGGAAGKGGRKDPKAGVLK
jgi:hypothetical protein